MAMREYRVKIGPDVNYLQQRLKEVDGSVRKITDKEFIIGLDVDKKDAQKVNQILDQIVKNHPEIGIQFQYDVNKQALADKLRELEAVKKFQADIDTGKVETKIKEMVADIEKGFNEGVDTASLKEKITDLYKYINTAAQSGIKVPKSFDNLKEVDSFLDGYISKLQKQRKPATLFEVNGDMEGTLERVAKDIDFINESLETLRTKGAVDKSIGEGFERTNRQIDKTSGKLKELKNRFDEYFNQGNTSQLKARNFWDILQEGIDENDESVKQLLSDLRLLDENGNLSSLTGGGSHYGGLVGSQNVAIVRRNEIDKEGNTSYEKTLILKKALDEAYDAGVNVARIIDVIGDNGSETFLELQEKASGVVLGLYDDGSVNADFLKASDDQIKKLIEDIVTLQKLGIRTDISPENILFDEKKGFQFIDLGLLKEELSTSELIEDAVQGIAGEIEGFYEQLGDQKGIKAAQDFAKKFSAIGESVKQTASEIDDALDKSSRKKISSSTEKSSSRDTVSPTQEFDNEVQKNLTYLENYKNTIKEIDRLKLEPETDETKKKLEELNRLAEYFVSNMTAMRSENGHEISSSMMRFGYSWAPNLADNYNSEKLSEMYQIAQKYSGMSVDKEAPDLSHIREELSKIESQSESTRKSLAKDLVASKKYADDLAYALKVVVESREEMSKSYTSEKDKAEYQRDIDKYLKKYPEISEMADKFKNWDDVFEFTSSKGWNDFLATLPQARTYLESIGYSFEKLEKSSESAIELANAEQKVVDSSKEASDGLDKATGSVEAEGTAAKEATKNKEDLANAEREVASESEHVADVVSELPDAFEKSTGNVSDVEKLTDTEKELAEIIEKVGENAKETAEDISKIGDPSAVRDNALKQAAIDSQNKYRESIKATLESLREQRSLEQVQTVNNQQNVSSTSANYSSVRDLAMQQEITDAQKKYRASIEETTRAIVEQTNADRNLEQYARRVPMTSEEAFQQLGNELSEANTKTKELEASLKKAMAVTKAADSAGSSLDLLSSVQQQSNKTATEMNREAAAAYNELKAKAKDYYNFLRREAAGSLTDTEREALEGLKKEWDDATAAVGKYKTAAGSKASITKLEKARTNFNESDDVIAIKYSQKLAADEKKLTNLANSGKYTSELTHRLEELAKTVHKINENPIDLKADGTIKQLGEIDKNITKAFDDAKISEFRKAHETSIAKLNLQIEEFMNKNSRMGADFKDRFQNLKIDWDTEHTLEEVQQLVAEFNKLKQEVVAADKGGKSFFATLRDRAAGVNAQLIAQYLSWQDIIRYIRIAADAVIELDTALTEMRKVSDESLSSLQQYQKLTFGIADEIGTTGLDLQKATADWMRLGESMNEAAESAKAATILMNVSEFESIEESTQALVSASQAYKELDKMDIVDVINNIGNNYSVATDELAQGLQDSAAVLKTQGNNLYEAVALLTAGNAVTQDISKVAGGTRTIALRLAGTEEAKNELVQMGEDVDDMIVGTHAKMQGLIKDYTAVASNAYEGIDILDANGNLRNTYDILLDIAKVYQEILDEDKKAGTNRGQALIEAIAGKNRANIAASILLNPEMLENVYETAKDSAGSAQDELDKYLESLEGHIKEFQNATQELFHTLIDSGMLANIIDFGTALVKILTQIVDKLGTIPSLGLGVALRQLILKFDKLPEASGKIATMVSNLAKASEEAHKVVTFDNASDATKEVLLNLEGLDADEARGIKKVFGEIADEAERMSPATEATVKNLSKLEGSFKPIGEAATEVAEATAEIGEAAAGPGVSGATKLAGAFKSLVPILTNPITIMAALAVATYALYKWVDGANDRQRKKIEELEDEYKSAKNELDSTNSELEKVDSQIAAIQGKGTLSLVEQQELERLQTQAQLLKIAREEQEKLLELKAKDKDDANQKLFNDTVFDVSSEQYQNGEVVNYEDFLNQVRTSAKNSYSNGYTEQVRNDMDSASIGDYNDNLEKLLSTYSAVNAAQTESLNTISKLEKKYGSFKAAEQNMTDSERESYEVAQMVAEETSEGLSGIETQINNVRSQWLQAEQDARDAGNDEGVARYESLLKVIDEITGKAAEWNAKQIGKIFNFGGIETTREELEALAAAGKLDDETINKYPKLKEAIESLDLILGPGETALKMFKDEMAATAEVAEEAGANIKNSAEAVNTWANERDAALSKLGLLSANRSGEMEYDESWTKYLDTLKALNPELAKNQEELEKCALANMQFDKAVSDLSSNFESYKNALKDANSLTPEFSDAINALTEDLTYLTGVNFTIGDTSKFLSDAENVNLLEQALKGSDEALQKLQARAAEAVPIRIDFSELEKLQEYTDIRVALGLDTEIFNDQLSEFVSWLNENSNMGELNVYAGLQDNEFYQKLASVMTQSKAAADAVRAIFKQLGWDIDWDYTKMRVPKITAGGSQKTSTYGKTYDENGKAHYVNPGGIVEYEWVEVPTNIRFTDLGKGSSGKSKGGSSTSGYTPKSLSPSQKSSGSSGGGSKGGGGGGGSSDKDTAEKAEDTFEEVVDFFERLIKVLDQKIDLLGAHLEDVVGSFAKNTLIDAQEDLVKQKMAGYSSAIDMYASKASEALSKVPEDIQEAVKNGAVAIEDFVGEANKDVVDAINDYQGWADKVAECKQQVVELREELRKLEIQKFDNIVQDFEEINKVRQDSIDLIDKEIALYETSRDKIVGRGFYDAKIDQTQKQMNSLYEERTQLIDQANEALANGIDVASEEWFHMLDAVQSVDGAIIDAEKSIEEYKNAIIQLYVDAFDREATRYANQISIREKAVAALEKQIAVTKSAGDIAGRAFYDEAIEQTEKQIMKLEDERRMLQEKMDEAVANGLEKGSDEWFSMVDSINSVDSAIQDATQSVNEYKDAIVGLYVDAFNREAERYSNAISLRQKSIDSLEKQIDVIEAAGNLAGVSLIEEQLKQTEKQIDMLQKEREELMRRMSDATANGVDVASDEWYSLVDALHEVDSSIQDCTIAVENLDNVILAIHTATFERIQNRFAGFAQELSNMAGMFDYDDVANADNTWTKEGLAQLGLQTQQYEIAKKQVAQYNEEIAELNSQYKNGKYSVTEYTERLAELKNAQWSAVQAAKSAKDNIVSLNQSRVQIVVNGINKEIEAYQKLINEQKNLLSSEKELHDYEKSLEDQNKTISNIERQLAAIEGDTSLVAAAKRAKLEDQLSSARDSLGELEYNHSIETQQAALDAQLEAYQETRNLEIEALQLSLEQEETLIAESFERVRENAILIGDEILAKAQELNITMSTELTAPWQAGEDAIASYSELLTVQSSVFMQQLAAVENSEWRLQEQANSSSQAISDMFANRSDDLVLQTDIANEHTRMEEEAAWNASRAIADMFGNQADNLIYETDLAIAEMRAQEEQAWNASAAIADAFAQRADNLVATIEDARNSTENLTRTSDALADSLNNSIDGYYSGASAVGALNDIAGAAYGVADAAREASSELERMIDLQAQADAHESNTASGDIYEIDGDDVVYQGHGKVSGSGVSDTNKKSGNTYHAHGVKSATHDYLAWTQENGPEFIVSPTSGAILSPLQKGDMVLPADKTANIWEWGGFNPQEFAQKLIQSMPSTGGNVQTNTMQVGSLVQVNGNVNDSMAMMEIAAQQAANKIKQSWQQLSNQLYG